MKIGQVAGELLYSGDPFPGSCPEAVAVLHPFFFFFFFLSLCLFVFLGLLPWHMEVPRLGVKLEL